MQGEVMALDASAHTATIAAGKIGDWMEAMTMEYPVKPDAEFQKSPRIGGADALQLPQRPIDILP